MSKHFPKDYSREELLKLLYHHYNKHAEIATKYENTLEKLIAVRKELSNIKRKK